MSDPVGASSVLPVWAPRVEPSKIRRLYESDARGLMDEELLDEVGTGFYARVQSILVVQDAVEGRVHCPACGTVFPRQESILSCPSCQWSVPWRAYLKTYQSKRLTGGYATPEFRVFIEGWGKARTVRDKMLAVDRLINAIHTESAAMPEEGGRPAAVCVIEGNMWEVVLFLDSLAFGEKSTPGIIEAHRVWVARVNRAFARWSKNSPDGGKGRDSIEAVRRARPKP
ncbi:MAG: hypothetical protein AAB152_10845 [Candidatus Coatesbacteria bacterium]